MSVVVLGSGAGGGRLLPTVARGGAFGLSSQCPCPGFRPVLDRGRLLRGGGVFGLSL